MEASVAVSKAVGDSVQFGGGACEAFGFYSLKDRKPLKAPKQKQYKLHLKRQQLKRAAFKKTTLATHCKRAQVEVKGSR